MSLVSKREDARLRELEASLAVVDGRGAPLSALNEEFVELLDCSTSCTYALATSDEGFEVEQLSGAGFDLADFAPEFTAALGRKGPLVGNPLHVEPNQRNVPLCWNWGRDFHLVPPALQPLWRRFGLHQAWQLRIAVCDGPRLLSMLALHRPASFGRRERHMLRRIARPLAQRLALEQQLSDARLHAGALGVTLDALGAEALIVRATARGYRIVEANALARTALDRDPAGVRAAIRVSAAGTGASRFQATPIVLPGLPPHLLLVAAAPVRTPEVARLSREWKLTQRQGEVLARILKGESNKEIASALLCSVRTVELHVSAVLAKASVENRAQLIARLLGEPGTGVTAASVRR